MSVKDNPVQVSVQIPQSLFNMVSALATETNHTVDEEVSGLLQKGLRQRLSLKAHLEQVRTAHARELEANGKSMPTTNELWDQMNRIREEVANELYPD